MNISSLHYLSCSGDNTNLEFKLIDEEVNETISLSMVITTTRNDNQCYQQRTSKIKNESFCIVRKKNKKANLQVNLIYYKKYFWRVKLLKQIQKPLRGSIDESRNSVSVEKANDSRMTKNDLSFFIINKRADSLEIMSHWMVGLAIYMMEVREIKLPIYQL